MKKILCHKIVFVCILVVCGFLLCGKKISVNAAESNTEQIMAIKSAGYCYTKQSAVAANRAKYMTFGQEVKVLDLGDIWATIEIDGNQYYEKSANLMYCQYMVTKYSSMVSDGAYLATAKTTKGYVLYGDKVTVLSWTTNKSGEKFAYCKIENLYSNTAGSAISAKDVYGYVRAANLQEERVCKVINKKTNLYSVAYTSYSNAEEKKAVGTITIGEQVLVLMNNVNWSKILYQDKIYYVSTSSISEETMNVVSNSAAILQRPDSGSKVLGYLNWNASVVILDNYKNSSNVTFYHIKSGNYEGYIREVTAKGVVNLGYDAIMQTSVQARIFAAAQEASEVLATLPAGTRVNVEYAGGTWLRISYNGVTGFMKATALTSPKYTATGDYYFSGYAVLKGNAGGTVSGITVSVLAWNDTYGYACVKTYAGNIIYMKTSSLKKFSNYTAYVSKAEAALYNSPDTDAPAMKIPYMSKVTVTQVVSNYEDGGWIQVKYNNQTYYIWKNPELDPLTRTKSTMKYQGNNVYQQAVLDYAMKVYQLPTLYENGQYTGEISSDGKYHFDCSGFVSHVLLTAMRDYVPIYWVSSNIDTLFETDLLYNGGNTGEFRVSDVQYKDMQPGDVIFFDLSAEETILNIGHCGIYLGNNEFMQSTILCDGACDGVQISPLNGMYGSKNIIAIKRFIPENVLPANLVKYTNAVTTVYGLMDTEAEPITILKPEMQVNLMYRNDRSWAYVEYETGKAGFVLASHLTDEITELNEQRYILQSATKLYTEADTNSDYIWASYGTQIVYNGQYAGSNYYKIQYEDKNYYIYTDGNVDDFLTDDEGALYTNPQKKAVKYSLKLRSTPDQTSAVNTVKTLSKGEEVTQYVLTANGNWAFVRDADGIYGYVIASALIDVEEEQSVNKYVKQASVKLYAEPTTDSDSILICYGSELVYKGQYLSGRYHKVVYENKEYYIYAAFDIEEMLTSEVADLYIAQGSRTIAYSVKLRSTPDLNDANNVIKTLPKNAVVEEIVISTNGNWAYIKDSDGTYGYVVTSAFLSE